MKTFALAFVLAGFAPACAFADVSKEEIRRLVAAGVSEDVVLSYVRQNGPVVRLSADDLVELKAAGAGDRILAALISNPVIADADLPYRTQAPEVPAGGVFGPVYVYDSRYKACFPVRCARPVEPLCAWGPTFTTVAPEMCRRPCAPVGRPACHPVVRSCGTVRH